MNIEFANRLAALRKEHGYSQEELAEKLGVSRQAVSKWECGESSPDTDNLIALAKIYGITLDELINPTPEKEEKKEEVEDVEVIDPKTEKELEEKLEKKLEEKANEHAGYGVFSAIAFPIALVGYLLLGFFWKTPDGTAVGWATGWILFIMPIIIGGFVTAIKKRKFTHFPFPVFITFVYVGMGIIGSCYGVQLWHPYWILFLLIPVYYPIATALDKKIHSK